MNKHTPGPWEVKNDLTIFSALGADSGDGYKSHSTDGWQIADCSESLTFVDGGAMELGHEVKKANARLIAAAPDLLEALEMALNIQQDNYGNATNTHINLIGFAQIARAAIAKARGAA